MTDPISFTSTSPRFGLPLLFAGQSQKEVSVNEALLAADILLHPAIEAVTSSTPATPTFGQCWIVGSSATGAFAGHTNHIAAWSEGGWRFLAPRNGMRVFDLSASTDRLFIAGSWQISAAPATPSGGSVVDSQARAVIGALITALRNAGLLS